MSKSEKSASQSISELLRQWAINKRADVLGQNLFYPSYISGLGQAFKELDFGLAIPYGDKPHFSNLPNLESATVGYCIGLTLAGRNVLLVVKQLDFLYLGYDQLVNTVGAASRYNLFKSELVIVSLVVDTGYEGPQSCNEIIDAFCCSTEFIRVFWPSNITDMRSILFDSHKVTPGITLIVLSQSLVYGQDIFCVESSCGLDRQVSYTIDRRSNTNQNCIITIGFISDSELAIDEEYGIHLHLFGFTNETLCSLVEDISWPEIASCAIKASRSLLRIASLVMLAIQSKSRDLRVTLEVV